MKKNVASQSIGVQMITAADGTAFTGAVSVSVTIDNGTQAGGGGTAPAHEGSGYHSYTPTQAETNGDHIAFTFTGSGAIPATVQVYTGFPQTGDNFARLGAPAGASVSADVAAVKSETADILTDTAEIGAAGAGLTDLGGMSTAMKGEINTECDTAIADAALATAAALAVVDANVDTTLIGLAVVDANVDAILVDTGTTIPGLIASLNDFDPALDAVANVTLVDTTTTNTDMRGTDGASTAAALATVDANVDSILVDTGTDLPAQIAALNDFNPATEEVSADVVKINGVAEAAEDLGASAATIVRAAAVTGTLTTTQMSTDLTEATDDHYNGRVIIWTSGPLKDQATNITDYDGTAKILTFTAITEAPANGNTFVIV